MVVKRRSGEESVIPAGQLAVGDLAEDYHPHQNRGQGRGSHFSPERDQVQFYRLQPGCGTHLEVSHDHMMFVRQRRPSDSGEEWCCRRCRGRGHHQSVQQGVLPPFHRERLTCGERGLGQLLCQSPTS